MGNNLYKSEPIDRYGNYENTESRQRDANNLPIEKPEFVAVDSKIRKQTDALTGKEVVEFFKYYPELRRMIKDENIHPKVPPAALAIKPDETGNVETNYVGFQSQLCQAPKQCTLLVLLITIKTPS